MESIPPCLACPQCDVLPVVFLLSDMEDCLFMTGKAAMPLVWVSFLRAVGQGSTNSTPSAPQHLRGPDVSCSMLGQTLLTNHRPAMATGHCLGGSQTSLALLARSSWLDLVNQWVEESLRAAVGFWEQKCLFPSLRGWQLPLVKWKETA